MDKDDFNILSSLALSHYVKECDAKRYDYLESKGFILEGILTETGRAILEPYKVNNAVIMAAGLSSRFVPLAFDKPKGLAVVKGEVLIERQIRQLRAAGIQEIYVVIGYMKELFFYLEEKYGVKLIINNDYTQRNNNGTIWLVRQHLANTYICSSDNYFTENVFEPYVYESYYAVEYMAGKSAERGVVIDKDNRIIKTYPCAENDWAFMGHAYWSREFSNEFIRRFAEIYNEEDTKPLLWERIFDRFLDDLPPLRAKKYHSVIFEFDTINDLKEFDPDYLKNADSAIMDNICSILHCEREDLSEFELMNAGLTNDSFSFFCRGEKYVYRHCFPFSRNVVDRAREVYVQKKVSDLGFDSLFIHMDSETGWKLSRFVDHTHMDFNDDAQLMDAVQIMRKVHSNLIDERYRVDFRNEITRIRSLLFDTNCAYRSFQQELETDIYHLLEYVEADSWPLSLTHNDINSTNFLIHESGCELIDWEYAGLNDNAYDIAKLVLKAEAKGDKARNIISVYYGRACSWEEERHIIACGAIEEYYWLLWAIYLEQNGRNLKDDMLVWYRHAREYSKFALRMYEGDSHE